jgi:hypothetical protein
LALEEPRQVLRLVLVLHELVHHHVPNRDALLPQRPQQPLRLRYRQLRRDGLSGWLSDAGHQHTRLWTLRR